MTNEGMRLLPCPFCGGEACVQDGYPKALVICAHCDARTMARTKEKAAALWNRRANPPASGVDKLSHVQSLYDELLMAVEKKHPNESRHNTALRYIGERETTVSGPVLPRSSRAGEEKK